MNKFFKGKLPISTRLGNLLHEFFNHASDASPLECGEQEGLEKDFSNWIDREGGESIVISIMHDMCCESLGPDTYDKWEEICKVLYNNRKVLRGTTPPWE